MNVVEPFFVLVRFATLKDVLNGNTRSLVRYAAEAENTWFPNAELRSSPS